MQDENGFFHLRKALGNVDQSVIDEIVGYLARKRAETISMFHLSPDELGEIEAGSKVVSHVVFRGEHEARKRHLIWSRVSIAALVLLLVCCLAVEGFADSVRGGFLSIFRQPRAMRVDTMVYDRQHGLSGLIVPNCLLEGYHYATHTVVNGSEITNVVYTNADGKRIDYYYYPNGASASYDNERTEYTEIRLDKGVGRVGRTGSSTTLFLLYDTAYVQLDIQEDVTDDELRAIVSSIQRVQ